MSRCKCPKSDVPKRDEQCLPYFEDITTKMEERRCDLIGRQKNLREKITTMERSIPALIAYNMWMSKKCDDAPYCKVRQIMKKFSPYPDQTEKLLSTLKKTVKELNGETEELHEKIIQTDVKLEEKEMELESLELVNKEMMDTVSNLEREVRRYTTPSLHSIHSEDVLCLTKIRELAEEELNLKHCIKDLEQKETVFKEHMDRLLTCKEYQNACSKGRPIYCTPDLQCTGNKICCVPKKCLLHKQASRKQKPEAEEITVQTDADVSASTETVPTHRDHETKTAAPAENVGRSKSSWISDWWKNNKKPEESPPQQKKTDSSTETEKLDTAPSPAAQEEEKGSSDKSPKLSKPKETQCQRPCFDTNDLKRALKSCMDKFTPPCSVPCNIPCKKPLKGCAARKLFCELPRCKDHGIRLGCTPFPLPCDLRGPCEMCPSMPCKVFGRPVGNCRCNCKGKCALGLSSAVCNCSDEPLGSSEEYQPIGSKQLTDSRREESNSDDEFCECCECGCEDSDEDLLCNCN